MIDSDHISPSGKTPAGSQPKYLRRKEAANYVRDKFGFPCSPQWLAKLAVTTSDGPIFRKSGRIPLYDPTDLDNWALARISKPYRSTAEYAKAA